MKLRTRQAPAETALRLFTERGHDATTLDGLYDAVEVSQCTLIRNYRTKEDVALAPDSDLWSAYLDLLAIAEPTRPLLGVLRAALPRTTLDAMSPDWDASSGPSVNCRRASPRPRRTASATARTPPAPWSAPCTRAPTARVTRYASDSPWRSSWRPGASPSFSGLDDAGRRGGRAGLGERFGATSAELPARFTEPRQRSPNRPDPRRRGRAR
ncbi:helix-turn-helix domain-containing protein [Streptomyces albidoflavus]|uniref:TetR/AcrR family transcriptional regulator n=1 Tax=Streptomyces albidoflavus TaxID=1886 RepID=UPI00340F281D|nr:TetR/AcrR family transcriptional regulator [Streptomyces albidoflavus]